MDDFIKSSKNDLRETRFSQNQQTSIELTNHEDIDYQYSFQRNTCTSSSPFKIKNAFSFIHPDQSFIYTKCMDIKTQQTSKRVVNESPLQKQQLVKFTKSFQYFNEDILTRESFQSLQKSTKQQINMKEESQQKPEQESDESDEDNLFSEKLSLIRGLEEKLSSLKQKIKVSSVPVIPYYESFGASIKKEQNLVFKDQNSKNQICYEIQKNDNFETNQTLSDVKSIQKSVNNISIESESLLLERDSSIQQKQILNQNVGQQFKREKEVQIIEVVKVVEIPYLIEVVRQQEQKIQSKKSFYFEENQQIHKTFQEFTLKQSSNLKILNVKSKIEPLTIQEHGNMNDFQLQYSGTNIIQNHSFTNQQNSVLSMQESNKTFHHNLKQKRNNQSFHYDEGSQILSKLLTKHNPNELQEFQEKLKSLSIQNEQLREKLEEKTNENQQLVEENKFLTKQLESLIQFQYLNFEKLKQNESRIENLKQYFSQIQRQSQQRLKEHYEKIIEKYEEQQTQYANRIIAFEQLFEESKSKQQKLTDFIEEQGEHIRELEKLCHDRQLESQNEANRRMQTQELVMERQRELKSVIEGLQKDNTQLKNAINQMQSRYESEGFFILKQEAEQIKKTIEQKDLNHIDQLEKLQNRYTSIIQRYQTEIQNMKKGLQKVRIDKSVSISRTLNSQQKDSQSLISQEKKQIIAKKRDNLFKVKLSQQSNLSYKKLTSESFDQLSESNLQKSKSQQLLVKEVFYLQEQNNRLKMHLFNEKMDKQNLSLKLSEIAKIMSKQIQNLNDTESKLQKNETILQKCVEELQKQYQKNKQLRQELQKTKEKLKNQLNNEKIQDQMDDQEVKLHPLYIQLNKKYIKSKKYIKVLERQLLQLTLLPQFDQYNNNKCCSNKDQIIKELKQIAFDGFNKD